MTSFPRELELTDLPALREALSRAGQRLVLANGVFDLLHVGHVRYLEAARQLGDRLLVAINDDESTRALKGPGRPVVPAKERAELVASLRVVDHVVLFGGEQLLEIIRVLRPDVQAKGTDYTEETIPEAPLVRSLGGRVAIVGDPKEHHSRELAKIVDPMRQR
ncbi:MAG: adenylyltransferase/cytidyltransferase family protein [Myxococcales bacterium]|nr:adenylyltransferase/cytidyltransferase family protein [Myxococcales bacterium]